MKYMKDTLTLKTWYPSVPPPGIGELWDPPILNWQRYQQKCRQIC